MAKKSSRPPGSEPAKVERSAPARITLLYESRDKQLCLFQDANGHLTAVRSARLA